MDASSSWDRGLIGEAHPIQYPTNASISTSGQELLEIPSKEAGSKSVDLTKGSNAAKLQTAFGSMPTESLDGVFSACVSAKASVLASAVSSMTALITAATITPVTRKGNVRSTFLPLSRLVTSAAGIDSSASSLFQGCAPWPEEGPRIEEEYGDMEVDKSTTGIPSPAALTSVRSEHTAVGSTRTSQRRRRSSSQGALAEERRGVDGGGGAAGKAIRAQMELGSSSSNQPQPGWKYEYKQTTRYVNGDAEKAIENTAEEKASCASSDGNIPTSPEGGAELFVRLRKRHQPGVNMEAIKDDPEQVAVKKGWRNMITSCEHTDAPHYGKGFCRPCYMRQYHRARRSGGVVVRLPVPSRLHADTESLNTKGASSSGSKEDRIADAAGRTWASADIGRAAAAQTGGGVRRRLTSHGLGINVPTSTALPPPLCGVCGQTETSWRLVLICDGCEGKFHLGCQGLSDQPFGEWFCSSCTKILLDSDSDSNIEHEAKPYLPDTGRSSSTIPPPPSPRRNAAVRNPVDPVSTKACTRSTAVATEPSTQWNGVKNPSEKTSDRSRSGESTAAFSGHETNIGDSTNKGGDAVDFKKGHAVGNTAMGWQTPRPTAAATRPSALLVGTSSSAGERRKGRFERTAAAAVVRGGRKWTLKGDVRGCRCPTCVSILLQSGGTRPPEATELIVPSKATAAVASQRRNSSKRSAQCAPLLYKLPSNEEETL